MTTRSETSSSSAPIRDEYGRVTHFLSSQVDVTCIREADRSGAALSRSEAGARLAAEAGRMGTWDLDFLAGVLVGRARCRACFGLPPDAPVAYETFLEGCHPDDQERLHAAVVAATDPNGDAEFFEGFPSRGTVSAPGRWGGALAVFFGSHLLREWALHALHRRDLRHHGTEAHGRRPSPLQRRPGATGGGAHLRPGLAPQPGSDAGGPARWVLTAPNPPGTEHRDA